VLGLIYHNKEVIDKGIVALMFLILIASSYVTQILGLHALFGAFIAGMVMPDNLKFRKIMTEKVEDVSLLLFLPLFFVSTGLRTEIDLLNSPDMWWMCGIITLGAIIGKFGGAFSSAMLVGESLKNSLYIGAFMNTRGLMELVVLTIGYEMHILPPSIFVMLIIMTLVTTFMTAPLTAFIKRCFRKHDKLQEDMLRLQTASAFRVLLSFGRAANGRVMLNVAHQLFAKGSKKLEITALHLTLGANVNPLHAENFEAVSFGPILHEAQKLGLFIKTKYEVSNNASKDIVNTANAEQFDFLLVGANISLSNLPADIRFNDFRKYIYNTYLKYIKGSKSWFSPGPLLKDKTNIFIEQSSCPVGVFINRKFVKATNIILIVASDSDLFLLKYARTLVKSASGNIGLLDLTGHTPPENNEVIAAFARFSGEVKFAYLLPQKRLSPDLFIGHNFLLVSYKAWKEHFESDEEIQNYIPSTLILSK
jgi:hypothetical protein